jgi:hypothetical protein
MNTKYEEGIEPKFYKTTQTMVTMGMFSFKEKSPW